MRCSVFIATSLDGYIARPGGELDWLPGSDPDEVNDEFDAADHAGPIATADLLVLGRTTYDTVLGFGIGWPYDTPGVVLTSRPLGDVPDGADVRAASGDVAEVLAGLAEEGFTHAWVDGGDVVQQCLRADVVDDLTVTVVPVLLGDGVRLFGDLPADRHFRPDPPTVLPGGLVQTTWHRVR